MATRLCTACGRFSEIKNLKKVAADWKHPTCETLPTTFANKVLCVVCGLANDEKKCQLRSSGFKCKKCVGKAHRPEVVTRATDGKQQQPEVKEAKRSTGPAPGTRPITVSACVTCSLQLHIPPGQTLVTCPTCRTVMNPYDRDLRFMKCGSCRSLLQFSLTTARSSTSSQAPIVRCGRCDTPNYIPQSILHPPSLPLQSPPIVVSFARGGEVVITVPTPRVVEKQATNPSVLHSLPVHKYKTPTKVKERNSDTTECSFCLCDFEEGDSVRTLPCFHMFHQPEIDKWLLEHTECPLCKTSVL